EARARSPKVMTVLAASAVLLCLVPPLEDALPQVLLGGLSHAPLRLATLWMVPALMVGIAAAYFEKNGRRDLAVGLIAACTTIAVVSMVWLVYPHLGRHVSRR